VNENNISVIRIFTCDINWNDLKCFIITMCIIGTNVSPLKIYLKYQHHPLTTQSMVPPCLINNEPSVEMLRGTWPTMLPIS